MIHRIIAMPMPISEFTARKGDPATKLLGVTIAVKCFVAAGESESNAQKWLNDANVNMYGAVMSSVRNVGEHTMSLFANKEQCNGSKVEPGPRGFRVNKCSETEDGIKEVTPVLCTISKLVSLRNAFALRWKLLPFSTAQHARFRSWQWQRRGLQLFLGKWDFMR